MNYDDLKEVKFDIWCKTCRYRDCFETLDPCNECLSQPCNEATTKPVYYKEAK